MRNNTLTHFRQARKRVVRISHNRWRFSSADNVINWWLLRAFRMTEVVEGQKSVFAYTLSTFWYCSYDHRRPEWCMATVSHGGHDICHVAANNDTRMMYRWTITRAMTVGFRGPKWKSGLTRHEQYHVRIFRHPSPNQCPLSVPSRIASAQENRKINQRCTFILRGLNRLIGIK